jgi:hypothetical protein
MNEEDRNYQLKLKNRRLKFKNLFLERAAVLFALIAIVEFATLIIIHLKWN